VGSTRKFSKEVGRNADINAWNEATLACGCTTTGQPAISSPAKKWFCCGEYRRAKAGARGKKV